MFVLPPPPKYPTIATTGPILEPNNTLDPTTGPEHQLSVGEGTYIPRDTILLATPPPHPSETPPPNPNPLATTPHPPTSGTKLSLARLHSAPVPRPESPHSRTSTSTGDASNPSSAPPAGPAPIFGSGNPLLSPTPGATPVPASKRRKPKSNIVKSNSSFISRVTVHEGLAKRIAEAGAAGASGWAFANVNRALQWLDLGAPGRAKLDPLVKILFTRAHALCHDVNPVTRSAGHLDVAVGFSTGDLMWYEPVSGKYSRVNKNGVIHAAPVADVRWMPGSENLFLAAHVDGSLVVYDKEKEDAVFVPECADALTPARIVVRKSVGSKSQKTNPVAWWKVSAQRINAVAFAPDGRRVAVVSEDGCLKILDMHREV
ncbi:hypothetical protein EJ06DRAFT_533685 [Trichodelitschia bisporula]|uniref:WD40 repeat-like protein n=1 Tax=Trichodelitschia bisporula TaxID=703511 RepID=A0A6G1HM95_9PEZI|nr:hypothetical protein EJ06DRAFT_533685 [Trichodelitschia bisporula]